MGEYFWHVYMSCLTCMRTGYSLQDFSFVFLLLEIWARNEVGNYASKEIICTRYSTVRTNVVINVPPFSVTLNR